MERWQDPSTLLTLILITFGVFIFLVVSLFAITYFAFRKILAGKKRENEIILAHKNTLIQASLESQEKERIRIASELHDGIIGQMAAVRLQVAMQKPAEVLDVQLGNTIDELRRISHDLYPPMYETQNLDVLIANVLKSYQSKYEVQAKYNVVANKTIPIREKIQALRIVQELLHNMEKHARATKIQLLVRISSSYVALVFRDNGVGFDTEKEKGGQGLQNIELRCMSIQAHYKFKSKKNDGTTFLFIAPIS